MTGLKLIQAVPAFICLLSGLSWAQAPTLENPVPTSPLLETDHIAAQHGGVVEQLRYARDLNEGILGRRNTKEAFKWFSSTSQLGSAEATAWLGSMYLRGSGVEPDLVKAHDLITAAAAAGDKVGYRFLGVMCETGTVEKQDYVRALSFYKKASELGDANSFDKRGLMRLSGLGLNKAPKLAFALFSQGAELGDQWAELHLGQMYHRGIAIPPSTPGAKPQPDLVQAIKWLQASAKQNNRIALYVLGRMAEKGEGVPQSSEQAFLYFVLSAAHGYPPAFVALGRAHEAGRGTQVNFLHAYEAYSLAAERGEIQQAQDMLAELKRNSGHAPIVTDASN
jgi:TPR repeat protein